MPNSETRSGEQFRKATNSELGSRSRGDSESKSKKQHIEVTRQQGQLLNLRLLEEIDADNFAAEVREVKDKAATLRMRMDNSDRNRGDAIDIANNAFELSQKPQAEWFRG